MERVWDMNKIFKKYSTAAKQKKQRFSKEDQKLLALWAADCAEHVLPYFEKEFSKDDRPRKAIKACRTWVRTGVFKMADIRRDSLAAHAAAREAEEDSAARFAARAAGQAVATAHVAQHAYGAAYYALKAVVAASPKNAEVKAVKEYKWISKLADHRLPKNLRQEILDRIIIQKRKDKIFIKIQKDNNF